MPNRLNYSSEMASDEIDVEPPRRPRSKWSAAILTVAVGVVIAAILPLLKRSLTHSPHGGSLIILNVTARELDRFDKDCGRYPTASEGLTALGVAPPGVRGWAGPYHPHLRDAYGNALVYQADPAGSAYRLISPGEDGVLGTADDLIEDSIVREAQYQASNRPVATGPSTNSAATRTGGPASMQR